MHLSLNTLRMERLPDIVAAGIFQHRHFTRLLIDCHLGSMGAKGKVKPVNASAAFAREFLLFRRLKHCMFCEGNISRPGFRNDIQKCEFFP